MNRSLLWRTALVQVTRYRLRTLLILTAVAAAVVVVAGVQPLAAGVVASFRDYARQVYPGDVIAVSSLPPLPGESGRKPLTLADVDAVRAAVPQIAGWDPFVRVGPRSLQNAGTDVTVSIVGVSDAAPIVRRRGVFMGAFFSAVDVQRRSRTALLGTTTAASLFGDASPVGRELDIDRVPFEIVGVLEPAGADPHGGDLDDTVWIPYTTAMDDLLGATDIAEAALLLPDAADMEALAGTIAQVMRERHAIRDGYGDDFRVVTPVAVSAMVEQLSRALRTFMIGVIGAILAVAAVVVLGVMSVAMKQRSRELALRKALGARAADLRRQIGVEVLQVASAACVLGSAGAWLAIDLAGPALDRLGLTGVELSAAALVIAVAASVAAALLGSVLPVARAARRDAVDGLR